MKNKILITSSLIAVLLSSCSESNDIAIDQTEPSNAESNTSSSSTQLSDVPESIDEPSEPTPQFDWATAEVNEENIRKALSEGVPAAMAIPLKDSTFRKFVSSEDLNGEYIELTINPGTFADSKDFVKKAGGSLIAYSKILFQNQKIYEISLVVNIDNVAGGENQGVYISWRREQAKDVDYDKVLDNMFGDISIPYSLARKYSIQSELYNDLSDFSLPKENNM